MVICYTYLMHRTTIILDEETRRAARELALRLDCSTSEAIRRAIVRYHEITTGVSDEHRRRRVQALERLYELFEGHDPEAEIHQRKGEDEFF